MKATGIVRRIDDLGRIVIPKEIRRTMRIREGDPLEIYTDRDGGVIFRKYSPMGDVSEFSNQLCEALYKTTQKGVAIADREVYIASCGAPKRDIFEKRVSPEVEQIMEGRGTYTRRGSEKPVPISENGDKYLASVAAPVISSGDVMGCVVFFSDAGDTADELDFKLAQTAANFLGKQLES